MDLLSGLVDFLVEYGDAGLGALSLALAELLRQCHRERRQMLREHAERLRELAEQGQEAQRAWAQQAQRTEQILHDALLRAMGGGERGS